MGFDAIGRISDFVDPGWRLDRDRGERSTATRHKPDREGQGRHDDHKTGVGVMTTAEELAAEPDKVLAYRTKLALSFKYEE
jgi:hypothetical protein